MKYIYTLCENPVSQYSLYRYYPSSGGNYYFEFFGYNEYRGEFRWHQRMGGFASIEAYMREDERIISEEEMNEVINKLSIIKELTL